MELYDLDNDPRPKASQAVAAAKRARLQAQADDIAPASSGLPISTMQKRMVVGIAGGALAVALVAALSLQLRSLPEAQPLQIAPTASQARTNAFDPSEEQQAEADQPVVMVDVYGAPNGSVIGPVETTRQIQPVAHYGAAWVQAQVEGSGLVWIRLSDMPSLAIVGPDLQPRAAPPAPQTGQGLGGPPPNDTWTPPAAEPSPTAINADPAAPTNTPPGPTPVWATVGPVSPGQFEQPAVSDSCKFIGCVGNLQVAQEMEGDCHALFWQYGDDRDDVSAGDLAMIQRCIQEGMYR